MAINPFKKASSSPYTKRIAQGAGRGSLAGARQGFLATGSPVGSILGGLKGGIEGALMARPGEDEKQLRARMRRLERGVLGDEEAAIMGRFVDPVATTAGEQLVRSRAVASPAAATGAQAREAIAGQRAARGDIAEAAREGGLAVMDLEEQRGLQAQRLREGLKDYEDFRERRYEDFLRDEGEKYAEEVGTARALERLKGEDERRYLAGMSPMMASVLGLTSGRGAQAAGPRNAADISAISDEELDAFQLGGGVTVDEDVSGLQLGSGLVPRTRGEIEARRPEIEAALADLSRRTGVPLGTEALQAPGSREALGTGLGSRGPMFQAEVEALGDVGTSVSPEPMLTEPGGVSITPQQQRFRDRVDSMRVRGIDVDALFPDDVNEFVFEGDDNQFNEFAEYTELMPPTFYSSAGG